MSIAGYTYKADTYDPDCMRDIAKVKAAEAGSATMWGDCGSAEDILSEWASAIGLDRADERSFDSGEFPKIITGSQAHDACTTANGYDPGQCADACGVCGYPIGDECPNGYEGPNTIPAGLGDPALRAAHHARKYG